MNGVSRFIMDSKAHERIHQYYIYELEDKINTPGKLPEIFYSSNLGKAFRAMIIPDRLRKLREKMLVKFQSKVKIISLKKDRIIPARYIAELFRGNKYNLPENMEVLDFPYPYCHENPFPVKIPSISKLVDQFFEKIFTSSSDFLATF